MEVYWIKLKLKKPKKLEVKEKFLYPGLVKW
jgi:hypothetical protein